MGYTLRDYQQKCHQDTLDYIKNKGKAGIVVAPTAHGKALQIAQLTHDYEGGVIVLSPSKEILEHRFLFCVP